MRVFVISGLALAGWLALGSAVLADPATDSTANGSAAPAAAPTSQADDNQVICKRGQAHVGSRLPDRPDCRTKKQWAESQQSSKDMVQDIQSRSLQGKMPGG